MKLPKRLVNTARRLQVLDNVPGDAQRARDDVVSQKLLMNQYCALPAGEHRPFRDVGWGLYSQNDEDGILLYLFSRIGARTRCSVEICAGNGIECNTANLLLNHRWTGLLVDGAQENIATATRFYQSRPETMYWPPAIVKAWLTRGNVNAVVRDAGCSGEIDLLSLDVDGVDYWLWEALDSVWPRVVVLEYNHLLGPDVSVSVPYRDDFVAEFTHYGGDYAGASLRAFVRLGERKGYRFVGTNSIGTNAFFVRNEVSSELVPAARPEDAFSHPRAQFGVRVRYEGIKHKEWVNV